MNFGMGTATYPNTPGKAVLHQSTPDKEYVVLECFERSVGDVFGIYVRDQVSKWFRHWLEGKIKLHELEKRTGQAISWDLSLWEEFQKLILYVRWFRDSSVRRKRGYKVVKSCIQILGQYSSSQAADRCFFLLGAKDFDGLWKIISA